MIILIIILALIAIAGFIITTIMRKGLSPQDEYDRGQLKLLSLIRTGIIIGCAAIFAIAMLIGGIKIMDQTDLAAEGEARALEITREALENMPDTWIAQQYLEKWDGKLPQFITGDGTSVMLTPDLE